MFVWLTLVIRARSCCAYKCAASAPTGGVAGRPFRSITSVARSIDEAVAWGRGSVDDEDAFPFAPDAVREAEADAPEGEGLGPAMGPPGYADCSKWDFCDALTT